jgi:hypothetical protein
MCCPFKVVIRCNQDLSSPDCAIGAIAGAVKAKADDRLTPIQTMLGHHGSNMGVMVLDLDQRPLIGVLLGPACRQIAGVEVTGDDLRRDAKE